MTDTEKRRVRDALGHDTGTRRVRVRENGEVEVYGSVDCDPSQCHWVFYGFAEDVLTECAKGGVR